MRDKKLNGGVPTRLIVDMDFRSQFEVARPTRAYKELIDALPSIFVGTEKKLKEIVSLLCPACRKSLKETGLHIPPWRSASYMQSKWLSTNCKKVTFSPNNELGVDQSEEKGTSTCCPFIFQLQSGSHRGQKRREDKIMICDYSFVMMMDGFCIFFKSSILKYPEAMDKTCQSLISFGDDGFRLF